MTRNTTGGPDSAEAVEPTEPRSRWVPLVAIGLAMLAVSIDTTVVSVVLPVIGGEFHVGPGATTWLVLGTSLPMAVLTIPLGRWSDGVNVRSVLTVAVAGIVVVTVLAITAPAFWVLIAARALLGIFSALVMAVYLPTVAANVHASDRGRAMGYTAAILPLGTMVGSSLGGFVGSAFGWRVVLLLPIPLLIASVLVGRRSLDAPSQGFGLPAPNRDQVREAIFLGVAILSAMLAADRAGTNPLWAAGLGVVAVVLAVRWARLPSSRPVLDLVRRPSFGFPLSGILLAGATIAVTTFLLPYFVADVLGQPPSTMGIVLLFSVAATATGSPVGGILADRIGTRWVSVAGAVMSLGGLATMLTLTPAAGTADIAWRLAIFGFGGGLFGAGANTSVLAATPPSMAGTAGGLTSFGRTFGSTIGPLVSALAWTSAGGGVTGFRVGVAALAILAVPGMLATVSARKAARTTAPAPSPSPAES